ncbi:MAG: alpha-amylase family glycosyl hydrolase [Clostridiaceae bacterium]
MFGKESKLRRLSQILEDKFSLGENIWYYVPDLWNCFGYDGSESYKKDNGEMYVNPYKFYHSCINECVLKKYDENIEYSKSIIKDNFETNDEKYLGGDWIKKSSVYSIHIRTATSFDHNKSGELEVLNEDNLKETGTFVKAISLLPLLVKMGIDVVYMLPITSHSTKFKKGDMGSPYSIKDFFKIDDELKDPMTGEEFTVEDEFAAFVEACHILNIKVLIDIIPRTAARDNNLIIEHPEWFYWLKTDKLKKYKPPFVPGIEPNSKPTKENIDKIYLSIEVQDHIRKFSHSPNLVDKNKWKRIKKRYEKDKTVEFIDLIEKEFGLTTAPAFSDCINDPQPPWDDVTYFRLYLDHPIESKNYFHEDLPPYILFDTIKGNMFKGEVVNQQLWETLCDIIPYFQDNFGIDGARIDMGHALPKELVEKIIKKPKEINNEFCFIAEELYPHRAEEARKLGYNMIIGQGFYKEPRYKDHSTHGFMYDSRFLKTPVFACAETHDTARVAARDGGENLAKALMMLNLFMPNGVPFINSGMEILEKQPMNLGLDCRENEQFILPENDPFYGKLALFDKYSLHWCHKKRWEIPDMLDTASRIRDRYIDSITDLSAFVPLGFGHWSVDAVGFGYLLKDKYIENGKNTLIIIGNTNPFEEVNLTVNLEELRNKACNYSRTTKLIYSPCVWTCEINDFDDNINLRLNLKPGEVKILIM